MTGMARTTAQMLSGCEHLTSVCLVASGCEIWPDVGNKTPKLICRAHTHLPKPRREHLPLEPVGRAQELPSTRCRVHLRQEVVPAPCMVAQSTSFIRAKAPPASSSAGERLVQCPVNTRCIANMHMNKEHNKISYSKTGASFSAWSGNGWHMGLHGVSE